MSTRPSPATTFAVRPKRARTSPSDAPPGARSSCPSSPAPSPHWCLSWGVFAGGTEATITGALLLGFGFGWPLVATLTLRRTRQPQRWAVVRALTMGTTGAALVALAPGSETLTALNWLWPPLVLALAVWMFVQVRRSVTGKARWVITPVIAVQALTSIGATYENIALTGDATYAAPGKLYHVGDHQLHLDCGGEGSPTVVLSNSLGGVSAGWARITHPVAEHTRVCAYDRAGQGWSDEAASPRDGVQSAEELHSLLAVAGEEGPYVLVGHSTGGTYAMTYAARYPEQVAGLVLLDSSSPEQFTAMPAFEGQYAVMRRAYALLPTLSRLGLSRLVPATSHLPAADAAKVEAITSTSQGYRNQRDEVSVLPDLFTQAQALSTLGDTALAVLTASENSIGTEGWADAQDQLRRPVDQPRPPHRGVHPHRAARGRRPCSGVGPCHHRGHSPRCAAADRFPQADRRHHRHPR